MDAFTVMGAVIVLALSYQLVQVHRIQCQNRSLRVRMAFEVTSKLVDTYRWRVLTSYGILPATTCSDLFDAINGCEIHRYTHTPEDIFCNLSNSQLTTLLLTVRYALNEVNAADRLGSEILDAIDELKKNVDDFDPCTLTFTHLTPVFNATCSNRYNVFLAHMSLRRLVALHTELHENLPRG